MATTTIALTKLGTDMIYKNGVYNAFKSFNISDAGLRYDITPLPKLTQLGGTRTLVTTTNVCKMSNTKSIEKIPQTKVENKQETEQLKWSISRLDCGGTSYEGSNPNITVNFATYFNYLTNTIGNYNYENKGQIDLTDGISANINTLNPQTFGYDKINTVNDLNINYVFETKDSVNNYTNLMPFMMANERGAKTMLNTTTNRFPSYMTLVANTQENSVSKGANLKMGFVVNNWGYVTKNINDKSTTFNMSDFVSITTLEAMTELEIKANYRVVLPAARTDMSNKTSSLFPLKDLTGAYTSSVDNLSTLTDRFENSDGVSLMTKLIEMQRNYIRTNFKETTTGVYEQKINMRVTNNIIKGAKYSDDQIIGGNITINMVYDENGVNNVYDDIVTWLV